MNYLIDSYTIYAASVLAANSVLRSLFGAVFPLFTSQMYARLGIHWASSVPAFLALGCVPFPFLFYRYGAAVRGRCKFAREAGEKMLEMMENKEEEAEEEAEAEGARGEREGKREGEGTQAEQEGVEVERRDSRVEGGSRFEEAREKDLEKGEL